MFNTISIIGCGLIGSSILRAIHDKNLAKEVRIFDLSKEVTTYLKKENICSNISTDIRTDYYCSHGSVDQVLPVSWARNSKPFLDNLGFKNEYSEYNVGHGVAPQNFFSFKKWIEARL